MGLRFATGFLCSVEGAIKDLYAALGIRFVAIGSVRSERGTDFLDVVRGRWLAFKIPSSKLHTHNFIPFVLLVAWLQFTLGHVIPLSPREALRLALYGRLPRQLSLPGCFKIYEP